MQESALFLSKIIIFVLLNLHISKKSCNFAENFERVEKCPNHRDGIGLRKGCQ